MKRIMSWLLVLILCLTMAVPVMADESDFVESIPDKNAPDFVPETDDEGNEWIARILDKDGNVLELIPKECLVITAIADVHKSTLIPKEAADLLVWVYEELLADRMQLPYEKIYGLNPDAMVIRDLFDLTWLCDNHPKMLEPEGIVLEVKLDLGISADTKVYPFIYKYEEWGNIVSITNNGDGTVTCVFEHLCPVAFAVEESAIDTVVPPTGDTMGKDIAVWATVMVGAAIVLVGFLIYRRKTIRG